MPNMLNDTSTPYNEEERLAKLYGYNILNNYEKTGAFQDVVGMAVHIFKVPLAFVNFIDSATVFTNSSIGMDGVNVFARDKTICSQAVLRDNVTAFKNTKIEPCLATNAFVHGEFGLQFYAAAPLKTKDGFNIGVVAIADLQPRAFSTEDEQLLKSLATIVMEELEKKNSMNRK